MSANRSYRAISQAHFQSLDTIGLIEGLLSPNGATLVFLLPLALFFYAVRLILFFPLPGVVVGALILFGLDTWAARTRRT